MPDADDFRALARSSPWLFTTLRFTFGLRGEQAWTDPVRAWLRRPDVLRVETVDGAVVQVVREQRPRVGRYGYPHGTVETLPWPRDPGAPEPRRRPDGLVAERPSSNGVSYDDPMYQSYAWVAALDPVELADGRHRETGEPAGSPLEVGAVREVEHGGRPVWEAVVATTSTYEPRCGCCALLHDEANDRLEWEDWAERFADVVHPTATRVRLDLGTGVCVLTEALDGTWTGDGHELVIEAVDEPMDDALFVEPRRPLRWGWSPFPRPGRQ